MDNCKRLQQTVGDNQSATRGRCGHNNHNKHRHSESRINAKQKQRAATLPTITLPSPKLLHTNTMQPSLYVTFSVRSTLLLKSGMCRHL